MDTFLLSKVQKEIIESEKTLINITYDFPETAITTIVYSVFHSLLEGKSILLIVPDEALRRKLEAKLTELNLSSLLLTAELDKTPSIDEVQLLKTKLFVPPDNPITKSGSSYPIQTLLKEFKKRSSNLYTDIIPGLSPKRALNKYIESEFKNQILLLYNDIGPEILDFKGDEKSIIEQAVFEATLYYSPSFENKDFSVLNREIQTDVLLLKESEDIIKKLSGFYQIAVELRVGFLNYIHKTDSEFLRLQRLKTAEIQRDLDKIEIRIKELPSDSFSTKKGIFTNLLKNKTSKLNDTRESILKDLNNVISEINKHAVAQFDQQKQIHPDLNQVIESLRNALGNFDEKLNNKSREYIKSINRHNTSDETLEYFEQALRRLFEDINHSGILKEKLELNTLSFSKQVELLVQLTFKLKTIISEVNNNLDYLKWIQLIENAEYKNQKIIKALKSSEKENWIKIFNGWYDFCLLKKHLAPSPYTENQAFTTLIKESKTAEIENISSFLSLFFSQKPEKFKKLKSSDSDLYKFLNSFKNPLNDVNWNHILSLKLNKIEELFPIILCDHDNFTHLSFSSDRNLITLEKTEVNTEMMQMFGKITYYWQKNVFTETPDFHLNLTESFGDHRQYNLAYRYPVARNLAMNILTLDRFPAIYFLKNTCILSYTGEVINNIILKMMHPFGIKKVEEGTHRIEALTGAFLEADNQIYCILEDGFLDFENFKTLTQQSKLMKMLEESGIKLLNFNSEEIFSQPTLLNQLLNNIAKDLGLEPPTSKRETNAGII